MDIFAHTLWVAVGAQVLHRRRPLSRGVVATTLTLAALPDVIHLLPLLLWWLFGDGSFRAIRSYAVAVPGMEPVLPQMVELWAHHLHCVMHSAIIAALVTLVLWAVLRTLWLPLLGWWSHVVIDVFTHSADYYAAPVLYPFTQRGFDGIAWTSTWFMVLNYTTLVIVGVYLLMRSKSSTGRNKPRSCGVCGVKRVK